MRIASSSLITTRISWALALMCAAALSGIGADKGFNGKWKGEIPAPAGPRGVGARGTPGNQWMQGRGGFGGGLGGGGRGAGFPGMPGGGMGPQKVTLNIKAKDKDTKATGNITIGEVTQDINDGRIEGTVITFRSGRSPAVYQYRGELEGNDEIRMTRSPADGVPGQPVQFVLKRS